jgi:hypothetical protein
MGHFLLYATFFVTLGAFAWLYKKNEGYALIAVVVISVALAALNA